MNSNAFFTFIFPALFITFGGIFIILGIVFTNKCKSEKEKISRASVFKGVIIDYKKRVSHHDGHSSTTYAPVIEYEWNGFIKQHISSVSYGSVKPVGSNINLYILPDGEVIDADGVKIFKILGTVFTLVGILAILIGIGVTILLNFVKM